MNEMSVSDFKRSIDEALNRAESGETIEIKRNHKTFAELRPRQGAGQSEWNDSRKRMIDTMRRGVSLGGRRVTYDDKYGDVDL